MILQSLTGLPAFLVYFCTAIFAVVVYLFVYTRITPHDEFKLIRDNDPAAAVALGLSLLGLFPGRAQHDEVVGVPNHRQALRGHPFVERV